MHRNVRLSFLAFGLFFSLGAPAAIDCEMVLKSMRTAPRHSRLSLRELLHLRKHQTAMELDLQRIMELSDLLIQRGRAGDGDPDTLDAEPEWLNDVVKFRSDLDQLHPELGRWPGDSLVVLSEGRAAVQKRLRYLRDLVAIQRDAVSARRRWTHKFMGGAAGCALSAAGAAAGVCMATSGDGFTILGGMALTMTSVFSMGNLIYKGVEIGENIALRGGRRERADESGFFNFIDTAAQALSSPVPGVIRFGLQNPRSNEAFDLFLASLPDGSPFLIGAYRETP